MPRIERLDIALGAGKKTDHKTAMDWVIPEAYIVSAMRTAGGRDNSLLSGRHPVDPASVDDVIFGCGGQVGERVERL